MYFYLNMPNYNKKLISELTNTLKENQWIKVSSIKYENFINRKITQQSNLKPEGTYYSKGGWLFHEICCNLDDEIIMIEVDSKNIYRITGESPYKDTNTNSVYTKKIDNFIKTYGPKKDKYWCSTNTKYIDMKYIDMSFFKKKNNNKSSNKNNTRKNITCDTHNAKNKCISNKNCEWIKQIKLFKYPYKTHSGFAIYPLPSYKWLSNNFIEKLAFSSYDVETLVLWNHEPVIKYYNLGTIREIIGNLNAKQGSDFTKYLVPKLIDKIEDINKIKDINKIEDIIVNNTNLNTPNSILK